MAVDVKAITEKIKAESGFAERLTNEIRKIIVGQQYMVDRLLIGILADGHILELDEKEYPPEYRRLARRLSGAVSEPKIRKTMQVEDEILAEFENIERRMAGMEKTIEEKDQALEENAKALQEKDQAIEEKEKIIEENARALAEKDRLIAELRRGPSAAAHIRHT